jgi:hypothetical protein
MTAVIVLGLCAVVFIVSGSSYIKKKKRGE